MAAWQLYCFSLTDLIIAPFRQLFLGRIKSCEGSMGGHCSNSEPAVDVIKALNQRLYKRSKLTRRQDGRGCDVLLRCYVSDIKKDF